MCIMSIVHDHYRDQFPQWPNPLNPPGIFPPITVVPQPPTKEEVLDMERIIREFREAQQAAAKLDQLMKQPDCVDPEKLKLQERVDALEKQIAQIKEILK